jgi:Protein of unknown function (DUF2778)
MIYTNATASDLPSGRGSAFSSKIALVLVAAVAASAAIAWMADIDPITRKSEPAPPEATASMFDARFLLDAAPHLPAEDSPFRHLVRPLAAELQGKFQQAKETLAQKLRTVDWQIASSGESTTSTINVTAIPVPRSRPIEASLDFQKAQSTQADDRTLLQKLSDLFPAHYTLASLSPGGGLLSDTPDLQSLGYDKVTAVYDISARAVYMPNGSRLEAHSGFGSLKDDPSHVSERNIGPTPPATYDLKPRERLFHGVQALRMIPSERDATLGRSGLLAHSYLLGPNGDSNGCVSIKNYEKFLAAFQTGEIKRLVVVASLNDASRGPLLKS